MRKRFLLLILFLLYLSLLAQRGNISINVEKFEDPYERSYYPIWYAQGSIYLVKGDTTKYVQVSGWGDADHPTFYYVNLSLNIGSLLFSLNPFRADIYNPKIQLGYTMLIFHPPRNRG